MQILPANLKAEIITHTHKRIVEKIGFFRKQSPQFLWKILPYLKPLRINTNEILFREGDYSEEIFFILNGDIKILNSNGVVIQTYTTGSYFGEIEILSNVQQ